MTTPNTLPRWDMKVVYPGLDSSEFQQGFTSVTNAIAALVELFDEQLAIVQPSKDAFEKVLGRYNDVIDQTHTLSCYISCFVATDSRDDLAQAKKSELQQHTMRLGQLGTRFTAWVGAMDVDAIVAASPAAREHEFALRQMQREAAHLMSPAEEALASELNLSGGTAWTKLHGNVTSQLTVSIELNGETQELPMSAIRNLAFDADRDVRRRAFEAELSGWEKAALPLAAAMNGIKGQVNTLSARRGWTTPLEATFFDNHIDQQTLDAMMTAAHEAFPDFRRYLKAKARALGVEQLAWHDLFAPVGNDSKVWEYDEATAFIEKQFGSYSTRMGEFAARAFRENWIDAGPRPGKRDGAYCAWLRADESRVFANYQPAFGGVSTLAHELGHAYHNLNLAHRTPLQRSTPMTLAETASIFCETIIRQAALESSNATEQVAILEASLQGACQVVVDITSRLLFEQRVFEVRKGRELSVDELNELMLQAQRETYGDGLDESTLHPYMWAMKPHYYSAGLSFYNYPYMFGLLFGLGLYARYQKSPEEFKAGYDELLSSTGLADAATLAAGFDIDIRTPDFWRNSFAIIRDDIDRFETLVATN